jgi:hypothetical protein
VGESELESVESCDGGSMLADVRDILDYDEMCDQGKSKDSTEV